MRSQFLSAGRLLDGRVIYDQPARGYRTGMEPVLLAASVPARPGDRVVEAGTGAGAGLLTLAARVGGLTGTGIERDPAMAGIARANLASNGHTALTISTQDLADWQPDAHYDHAFANPPWHADSGTCSPEPGRRQAKTADDALLPRWASALARGLVARGTLTFILPAASMAKAVSALLSSGCPQVDIQPLWPRQGIAAKLIVMRGVRLGRGASRILPGLVLHEPDGAYTEAAQHILRDGRAMPM